MQTIRFLVYLVVKNCRNRVTTIVSEDLDTSTYTDYFEDNLADMSSEIKHKVAQMHEID